MDGGGITRGKLEEKIGNKLQQFYPNLTFIFNDRTILSDNLELDIYIPNLMLAFEINGPHHYKNLYGWKYLKHQKMLDKKKKRLCEVLGIDLRSIEIGHSRFDRNLLFTMLMNIIDKKIKE